VFKQLGRLVRREAKDSLTGAPQSRPQTIIRLAVLGAVVLLAIQTSFAIQRLKHEASPTERNAALVSAAEQISANAEDRLETARAVLRAKTQGIKGPISEPLSLAEQAKKSAPETLQAVIIANDGGAVAQTGTLDLNPATLIASLRQSPATVISVPGKNAQLAIAEPIAGHPGWLMISTVNAQALLGAVGRSEARALASADGTILVTSDPELLPSGSSLSDQIGLTPEDGASQGLLVGRTPQGVVLDVALRPAANQLLLAVTVLPNAAPVAVARERMEDIAALLTPLMIGLFLALVILTMGRRVDETNRAKAEGEERFRLAVEAARCGIWEWDLKKDQVFLSEVTGAIFGFEAGGSIPGQDVIQRIAPDFRDKFRQALAAAAAYGAFDTSFRVISPHDGRSIWIDARGQGFGDSDDRGFGRIIGVALDVTQERFAQARAQAAEIRLRDAIESFSEAFVLWDRHGRLLLCNQAYRDYFSLEPRILKPGASRDYVARFMQLAIQRERPHRDGHQGVREAELTDGRWLQISERRTAEGGLVMTAADITAIRREEETRRLNEAQLEKAVRELEISQDQLAEVARKYEVEKVKAEDANKSKSEFLANMSHELRTPLNAINGFSEIMVGEMFGPLGDTRYKDYATDIHNSGQHLLALINDILDMSKIEAGKMNLSFEPLDLEDLSQGVVRLLRNRADAAGLELRLEFEALPEMMADFRALKQILLNLLSNAIKFTPSGGRITVRGQIQPNPLREEVVLIVEDTGIGIASEDLNRLAKPFEQVESQLAKTKQGTGLGLALTKSLIELHQGFLKIDSTPGVGTRVLVTLPVKAGQILQPSSAARNAA
jgi:two-component system cell cycle sensor histidine kinase PleC